MNEYRYHLPGVKQKVANVSSKFIAIHGKDGGVLYIKADHGFAVCDLIDAYLETNLADFARDDAGEMVFQLGHVASNCVFNADREHFPMLIGSAVSIIGIQGTA